MFSTIGKSLHENQENTLNLVEGSEVYNITNIVARVSNMILNQTKIFGAVRNFTFKINLPT